MMRVFACLFVSLSSSKVLRLQVQFHEAQHANKEEVKLGNKHFISIKVYFFLRFKELIGTDIFLYPSLHSIGRVYTGASINGRGNQSCH